jgi:hypothetical protein
MIVFWRQVDNDRLPFYLFEQAQGYLKGSGTDDVYPQLVILQLQSRTVMAFARAQTVLKRLALIFNLASMLFFE